MFAIAMLAAGLVIAALSWAAVRRSDAEDVSTKNKKPSDNRPNDLVLSKSRERTREAESSSDNFLDIFEPTKKVAKWEDKPRELERSRSLERWPRRAARFEPSAARVMGHYYWVSATVRI
jgi:hypothetical protein